jgi:alanyl-tRNA synthetase
VSQESEPVKVDGNNVLQLKGTGSTFVFYPFKPACPMKEGCGLPIASCDPDFNFPLYSHTENFDVDTPGGVNIAETDQKSKLESTISELETENKNLKSTIEKLQKELKTKEEEIPGKIESAIKVALEADRTKAQEQAEYNAAVEELRSCVSDELAEEYLKTEPTAAMIRSTIAIKKGEAGKQIGASGGNGGGDNKIMSTYKAGNDIYSKLGVEADDLEKYGGVTE